jgi:phosphate-selective porin
MGLTASAQAQSTLDDSRAYAAELLAQSEGRTSTLAQPAAAPAVELGGQIQFRYLINIRDSVTSTTPPAAAGEDISTGFQTRRTKLEAKGEIADGWSYFVQVSADPDGGSIELQEAWVKYVVNENSTVQWGQFKLPLLREELVSSKRQLAVERSVMNETFTQDRSQGIQYGWDGENMRFRVALSDGLDTENTDFDTAGGGRYGLGEADFAFTGRFEYMGAGDWKQFDDFTSWQGSPFA